jgi:TolC family type I secretion outer membrane protein
VTRTDVSQSEARLAQSQADRVAAEGQLAASREEFTRVVGVAPTRLSEPDVVLDTLEDREAVLAEAARNNPNVLTQRFSIDSVEAQTRQIFGETLPQVTLSAEVSRFENQQLRDSRTDEASIFATVSVPLYQSGSVSSRVRQSKQQEMRAHNALEDARRSAVSSAAAAYDNLAAAKARIDSLVTVITAAEIALDGVQEEAKVGSRTILDILDAEQELLNAQVSLVSAQRDEIVYKLELQTAIGHLTARDLGLQVQFYDFEEHYRETRGRWWGFDISED